jgi:type IV secretory pathway VirB4 component
MKTTIQTWMPPIVDKTSWLTQMRANWMQGQHVCIIGKTGRGKTTLARDLLLCRDYVVALAVKRNDATMERFTHDYGYYLIKKWPPEYYMDRVVVWLRPTHLGDVKAQAYDVHAVLDAVYVQGGYAVFLDDAGYIASVLKMKQALTVMLNQARSSFISTVAALTQPSSIAAQVPTETLRQVAYHIIFPFRNLKDIKIIADIISQDWHDVQAWFAAMAPHDFLVVHEDEIVIVRNTL